MARVNYYVVVFLVRQGPLGSDSESIFCDSPLLGGHFGYFEFFSPRGGEGESEAPGGGADRFSIENPKRGGGSRKGRGWEGVSVANRGILGGGGGLHA